VRPAAALAAALLLVTCTFVAAFTGADAAWCALTPRPAAAGDGSANNASTLVAEGIIVAPPLS
jgi:hypothetical protein